MSSKSAPDERQLKNIRRSSDRPKAFYVVGNEQYVSRVRARPDSNMAHAREQVKVAAEKSRSPNTKEIPKKPACRDDRSLSDAYPHDHLHNQKPARGGTDPSVFSAISRRNRFRTRIHMFSAPRGPPAGVKPFHQRRELNHGYFFVTFAERAAEKLPIQLKGNGGLQGDDPRLRAL